MASSLRPSSCGKRSLSMQMNRCPCSNLWISMGILTRIKFEFSSLSRSRSTRPATSISGGALSLLERGSLTAPSEPLR